MKKIAKTFTAFLIALCVLVGQSGVVLAMETAPAPTKCTKCPCESEKPTCCVEPSGSKESSNQPAVPAPESRVLQPVSFEPIEVGVVIFRVESDVFASHIDVALTACSGVPLFLQHRAILI